MARISTNLNFQRRWNVMAAGIFLLLAGGRLMQAQTPPYAEFQYATVSASGNTITATRLPVVLSSGTSYVNVVIEFEVDSKGNITVAPGYPTTVPAPAQLISNFLAGSYVGPATDGNYDITVVGPGVTTGGATEWSSATTTGASCYTVPTSATWFAFGGPMTKHPLYTRLKNAGITAQTYGFYSWGTTGDQSCNSNNWGTNYLIGVSQTGSSLMITSFTQSGSDKNQPVDQITYTNKNP